VIPDIILELESIINRAEKEAEINNVNALSQINA